MEKKRYDRSKLIIAVVACIILLIILALGLLSENVLYSSDKIRSVGVITPENQSNDSIDPENQSQMITAEVG